MLGQNIYTKSRLVNEIFNRKIFPSFDEKDDGGNYRLVRFKHGNNLSISLGLPGDYDLVDNLEAYNIKGSWTTIPKNDLLIKDFDTSDVALTSATLEVSLNHVLLRNGTVVVVVPSIKEGDISNIIEVCLHDVSPILLYGYETDTLTDTVCIKIIFLYVAQPYVLNSCL